MLEVPSLLHGHFKRWAVKLQFLGHVFTTNATDPFLINITGLYLCFSNGHWNTQKIQNIRNGLKVTIHIVVFWLMALCSLVGV